MLRRVGRSAWNHYRSIKRTIVDEPMNDGHRVQLIKNYLEWNLLFKYRSRYWVVQLENGLRTLVYPFPDHDAGEENIYNRNVDVLDHQFIRTVIEPGDFVVDAGCNVGNRTLAIADVVGGALLLDANPRCIARVKENLILNRLPLDRFMTRVKAVGDKPGKLFFTDLGGASTQNRVVDEPGDNAYEVEVVTIDDEVTRIGAKPSFIKIDVEGHDLHALVGARKTLQSGCVKLVKFEHNHQDPLGPLEAFFEELGWRVFALDDQGQRSTERHLIESRMNLFAMPEKRF